MIDNKEPSIAAINAVRALAAKQAADEGLWFSAAYASEAYLQNALRELAAAVEAMALPAAPIAQPVTDAEVHSAVFTFMSGVNNCHTDLRTVLENFLASRRQA